MNGSEYLALVRDSLTADRCSIEHQQIGPLPAIVGYRGDFLPQMLAKVHLVTVAATVQEATAYAVDDFTRQVGRYAKDRAGAMRGVQSGVAAFSVLVSDRVLPEAVAVAVRPAKMEFAARVQPVVVDLSAGTVHTFRGRQIWGFMLNGHLRRKLNRYIPTPPPQPHST